jgi:hypothetical protein
MYIKRSVIVVGLLLVSGVYAQTDSVGPWKLSTISNCMLTMNNYSSSWVGGEVGSVTWAININAGAEKQVAQKVKTANKLKLAFGQTHSQVQETKNWLSPLKSTDLIDFESVWTFTLNALVDPYLSVHAVSQFLDGRDTLLVRYGNPLDLTESFGGSRSFVKNDNGNLLARFGVAARQQLDRQKLDVITNTRDLDVVNDGGLELVIEGKVTNTAKWATFESRLKVFEALISSAADKTVGTPQEDDWRMPHVNWVCS